VKGGEGEGECCIFRILETDTVDKVSVFYVSLVLNMYQLSKKKDTICTGEEN